MNKRQRKIAQRDAVLGTFTRTVIPDNTDGLVRFTDRGVNIEVNRHERWSFYLKSVKYSSKDKGAHKYTLQLLKGDSEAVLNGDYSHLLIHLSKSDYPFCILTRKELAQFGKKAGALTVTYKSGNKQFRAWGGAIKSDAPLRIDVKRFWGANRPMFTIINPDLPAAA